MSDVSIDSGKSGNDAEGGGSDDHDVEGGSAERDAEGGGAEATAPAGALARPSAVNLFKNALSKQLKPEEKVETHETQVENTRNSLARFITNKIGGGNNANSNN